jgi:short-subunit dehydrogenase
MPYALITGASKGIGKAIAQNLANKGHHLLLIARSEDLLQQLSAQLQQQYEIEVYHLAMDLSEKNAATAIYNWVQQNNYAIDILVNNAGYGLSGAFENYPLHQHLNMMQVNMNAVVELTYLFLPLLQQRPKAYILNIASSAAYQAVPYLSLYAATKSFVLQFSRGLHHELKKTTVSVTCISPGATDTGFADRAKVGAKALKAAEKVNMSPEQVATIAVKAMYRGKTEIITGFINKAGAFLVWLLPKKLAEKTAAKLYE